MQEEIQEKENKKPKTNILLSVLKKHKLGILIITLMALLSSTMAWFIYNRSVDLMLTAKVKAWDIEIGEGGTQEDSYEIKIDALYPGMENIDTVVTKNGVPVHNTGEVPAILTDDVYSITLFGEEQKQGEDYRVEKSADGRTFKIVGYPFNISFILKENRIEPGQRSSLDYKLYWDYEHNEPECTQDIDGSQLDYNKCDMEDTKLGEASYIFNKENPDKSSLIIKMRMNITQAQD